MDICSPNLVNFDSGVRRCHMVTCIGQSLMHLSVFWWLYDVISKVQYRHVCVKALLNPNQPTDWQDLPALVTPCARLDLLEVDYLRIVKIEFGASDEGGNDRGCFEGKLRANTVKLTNMIIAFEERRDLIWKGETEGDEAKVASRLGGVECGVVCFVKLLFQSSEKEFSLRVKRFTVIHNEIDWKALWRHVMHESKSGGWK